MSRSWGLLVIEWDRKTKPERRQDQVSYNRWGYAGHPLRSVAETWREDIAGKLFLSVIALWSLSMILIVGFMCL